MYSQDNDSQGGNGTMKTEKELEALRDEVKALEAKLAELTEDELALVSGG